MKTIKFTITALCLFLVSFSYGQSLPTPTNFEPLAIPESINSDKKISTPKSLEKRPEYMSLPSNLCPNNLLVNGDFNSSTCTNFAPGCVPNWSIEDGSPNIFDLNTNPYAWMWSYGGNGEAISADFPFVKDCTYDICFKVKTDDINTGCGIVANSATTINLVATNAPGNVTAAPNGEIIFQGPAAPYLVNNTGGAWTTVCVQFTPTITNYTDLWIFPYMPFPHGGICQVEMCIDDVCIVKAPLDDGAFCCDSTNFVTNGNFEAGDQDFTSSYTPHTAVYPGNYDVTNSASAFGASVTDHSFCEDQISYPFNDLFMVVNGRTQQAPISEAVIWEQTILGLEDSTNYKFCANFKNMPQCTFDTIPSVKMEVLGDGSSVTTAGFSSISAGFPPCAWINKEFNFNTGASTSVTLRIILDETGNGDGNDLAIDDISVTKLIDPNLSITVEHQGTPQVITASINTINSSDDAVPCPYNWFIAEVTSYPPIITTAPISVPGGLTTTFPSYIFAPNTLYMIGIMTDSCGCYDEGLTYQLTLNHQKVNNEILSKEQKRWIIDQIRNGNSGNSGPVGGIDKLIDRSDNLIVYPNPVADSFTISLRGNSLKSVEVLSLSGQTILAKNYTDGKHEEIIDISQLVSGIYLVKAYGIDNTQYTTKVVKE